MRRVRRYAVGLARRRTPACHRSRPTGFPRGPSHRVAARRRPACPSRGSTIPRPALNATISSVAPGAARWVSPAAALCTPRRRGRGCSRSRRRGCSRFEAEPIQRRHMALDPLHLDALFGCPPPSGSERLVDRVDRGDGPPALGEIDGVAARAAAYVERATGHRGDPCRRADVATCRQRPFAPRERTPACTATRRGAPGHLQAKHDRHRRLLHTARLPARRGRGPRA